MTMTQKGEQLTHKGDFNSGMNSVFSFNKRIGVSFSKDILRPDKLNIKIHSPDDKKGDVYQMIFVLKGTIGVQNTNQPSKQYLLNSNQYNLYYVRPGYNTFLTSGVNDETVFINLDKNFINRYLPNGHPVRKQLTDKAKDEPIMMAFTQNMPITADIGAILQHFTQSAFSVSFSDKLITESKIVELLALQMLQYEQLNSNYLACQLSEEKLDRTLKAKEIIIENTGKQISLKALALMVGTNEFDLKRDFKIVFGTTVYGYLKQYKMEQAKSMLLNETMNVSEVSQKFGYKHATHFTSAFKNYFGYLPSQLRATKVMWLLLFQTASTIINCSELLIAP